METAMPKFVVWCLDYDMTEEDGRELVAADDSDAACEWAEYYDQWSAEYAIVSGDCVKVEVKAEDGTVSQFVVSGESMPVYRAKAVR